MLHSLLYFILNLLIWLQSLLGQIVPPAYAASQGEFKEDFSHGFVQWEVARGSLDLWSIEGEQAKATVETESTLTEIVPRNEYWNPNWKNIVYQFEYTPITGTDRNISFGYQNSLSWYDLHFVDEFYQLARIKNGMLVFDVAENFVLHNGKSYQMRLVLQNGHIQFFIDGQKIIDVVDWSFNQNYGKISLKATAGATVPTVVQFDNITVRPILDPGEVQLYVPLWKQTDLRWKDQEYDHAGQWSTEEPSIRRWGCALTSMVMIMHHYGINKFPDGQELTPATLNDWLTQQTDGYFDGGNLNWNAVTRLISEIHQMYGTVKLEYSYVNQNLELIKNEILNLRPVIIEIPGHFLVADGLSADQQKISIKDPAYEYGFLNQHQTEIISARKFLPSFTDLSALVISAPANIELMVFDGVGQILSANDDTHFLQDPNIDAGLISPKMKYISLAQPIAGKFRLQVKISMPVPANATADSRMQIFAYDREAHLVDLSQALPSSPQILEFAIDFQPNGASQITQVKNFALFRLNLEFAQQQQNIYSYYAFWHLNRSTTFASQSPAEAKNRYQTLLRQQLDSFEGSMTTEAHQLLLENLNF